MPRSVGRWGWSGETRAGGRVTERSGVSAGILLYRRRGGELEVFLAHPGGPFWRGREAGAWTIPKGLVAEGETLLDTARRELREETGLVPEGPFLPLGSIRQKAGKTVHAWACEGDADPARVASNTTSTEWPRGSGHRITYPEVDRCAWFSLPQARERLNPAQTELLGRLEAALSRQEKEAG